MACIFGGWFNTCMCAIVAMALLDFVKKKEKRFRAGPSSYLIEGQLLSFCMHAVETLYESPYSFSRSFRTFT